MDGRRAAASLFAVLVVMSVSLVVTASSSAVVAPEVLSPAGEAEALVAIKAALHDKSNVLGDWKVGSGSGSGGRDGPCHWNLVFCSDDGHVSGLELVHQNLSGTLSPAIGKLRRLRFLLLQHNDISGQIPDTIGRMKLIQRLDLAYNHFTGTIPGTLGHPRGIFFVRLSHNNLSGSIPDSLATSQSILLLDLSYNNLSDPVPDFNAKNVFLDGNPLLHNLSCEGSCSSVIEVPVPVPSAIEVPVVGVTPNHLSYLISLDGNPLLHNLSCEGSCSSGIEVPVPVPSAIEVPVAITTEDPSIHKKGLAGTARIVAFYISAALLIAFMLAGIVAVVSQWRRRHQIFADLDGPEICLGHLKQFMIKDIQEATNNFDRKNILGQGGFGIVYKGHLRDGTIVAVKRMKDCVSVCGDDQFHTEVEVISLIVHLNLLCLTGFCVTNNKRLLVYPFMPNGTVSSKLQEYICGKPTLDWSWRRRIALGAARGLVYLHEQCDPKIIHRDIKASNVLLDEYLEAVVADFGLAKLLDHGESHVVTAVRGTLGRIPPEYLMTGQTSEKTDVYGFGFLLIELITGRKTMELHEDEYQEDGILDWAKELLEENKLSLFVDSRLRDNYVIAELEEMVQIALLCTMYNPDHRPSMAEIVRMLQERDGSVAAKWETLKDVDRSKPSTPEFLLSPPVDFGPDEYDSIQLEAVELSGPR